MKNKSAVIFGSRKEAKRLRAFAKESGLEIRKMFFSRDRLLHGIKKGDISTVIVSAPESLGKSLHDLATTTAAMERNGIEHLISERDLPKGDFLSWSQLFGELDRNFRASAATIGWASGSQTGRPSRLTHARRTQLRDLLAQETSKQEMAKLLGVSRATIYRWIERMK